ncbi:GGDEF domain-containing protein [Pseudonocardia nematodicida]|uniref:GGDEF domain-containing protein n=1 Tax=Pseudonocardia nematodicida TaxID=1206997 RepID=A0ABV1KD08_9PSEU
MRSVARWPVWELRRSLIVVLLAVVLLAGGLVVAALAVLPADRATAVAVLGAAGLTALGVLHTELAIGIERLRRRLPEGAYLDLMTVWTFAGALVLPPGPAALTVLGVYGHLWFRVWRRAGVAAYRILYTAATVVLAVVAASVVAGPARVGVTGDIGAGGSAADYGLLLAAVVVYCLVNQALVVLALTLSTRRFGWRAALGDWDEHGIEVSTLCLAVLVALAAPAQPLLVPLVLPPLLMLHRAVLIRQLQDRVDTDAKTGLLTAGAWRDRAQRELARARRRRLAVAVLLLDLDHFKEINDGHGHLAGDEVLSAVAGTVAAQVRDDDPVGRFGGEEFVVLLAGLPPGTEGRERAHLAAERIRRAVSDLEVPIDPSGGRTTVDGVSVSVGVAFSGADRRALDDLLRSADYALYAAKRAGRNRVRPMRHRSTGRR